MPIPTNPDAVPHVDGAPEVSAIPPDVPTRLSIVAAFVSAAERASNAAGRATTDEERRARIRELGAHLGMAAFYLGPIQ